MLKVQAVPVEPSPLQKHLAGTYFTLRLGLGIIALAFPFLLAFGGRVYAGLPLQDSMSAYYHAAADGRSMRTWFVGVLFALGALLYLYKGFSVRENLALNIAGVATIAVAVFPMEWECGQACAKFSIHGASAAVAFLCIAYVAVFRTDETLSLIPDPARRVRFRRAYRTLAALMLLSPVAAFVLSSLSGYRSAAIFFIEAFGIGAFAVFWHIKGKEMRQTHAELMALDGTLVSE